MTTAIAVIFDFDDTLIPDSTTLLLKEHSVNTEKFWQEAQDLVKNEGYDPTHAFLRLFLAQIGKTKKLGELTNKDLEHFGKKLDNKFYPGVRRFFKDAVKEVAKVKPVLEVEIKFFVISGGLEAVIRSTTVVRENVSWAVGCLVGGDTPDGPLKYVKRAITFTEKTRYLFEINKFGLRLDKIQYEPNLVNKKVSHRDIPLSNMIYVGDGLTDIPCFSVVENNGGARYAVFDPRDPNKTKMKLREFLSTHRVESMHSPKFGPNDDLGSILRGRISNLCNKLAYQTQEAEML